MRCHTECLQVFYMPASVIALISAQRGAGLQSSCRHFFSSISFSVTVRLHRLDVHHQTITVLTQDVREMA